MASEFTLTPLPVRTTVATKQPIQQSLEVARFDLADALLYVAALEGTGGPTVTIRIITGMQIDSEDGWVVAGTFAVVSTTNTSQKLRVDGLLKYIRWEVSGITGTTPAVTFLINGMLRQN